MKYPLAIRLLHWIVALSILGLIFLGWFMTPYDVDNIDYSENLYFWHKSFGMLVLFLMIGRVLVRVKSEIPELPQGLPDHEKKLSHVAHILLYVLVFVVTLLGYVQSSSYEYSTGVHFFFTDLPELIPDSKAVFDIANLLHRVIAYTLLALVVLHVAGALKHRFLDKPENDVLNRIL